MKIVINGYFGGFSLSWKAIKLAREKGVESGFRKNTGLGDE